MTKVTSAGEARAALLSAAQHQEEVRVDRSIRRSDKINGFVVGVGGKWAVLAVRHDLIILDGYIAVRIADISRVNLCGGAESFVGRALTLRGQWPPTIPDVALDDTAGLVRTAALAWPTVTMHFELDEPDVCYVGRPVGFTTRSVEWRDISPQAEWDDEVTLRPLARVTRIDFGGRYEDALAMVGGVPKT